MPDSLDKRMDDNAVDEQEEKKPVPKELEAIAAEVDEATAVQESKLEKKASFFKKILDVGMYVGSLYLQFKLLPAAFVAATLIPTFGFIRSRYKRAKKAAKEFSWKEFMRTSWLGNMMGYGDAGIFSLPTYLTKLAPSVFSGAVFGALGLASWCLPFIGTACTLGLFYTAGLPLYNTAFTMINYFQNKVGFGKTLLHPHKFTKYWKVGYYRELKDSWKDDFMNVVKSPLAVLHYLQMSPVYDWVFGKVALYFRLLQSVIVNNKVYADAMERKKKLNRGYKNAPNQNYASQPA